jgi:hypothetical protein
MYQFGDKGVDVKLHDMSSTANIVWVRGNSYVRVAVPVDATEYDRQYKLHRNDYGEEYYIISVNGIGEIRWEVNNNFDLHRPENADVADYFKTRKSTRAF